MGVSRGAAMSTAKKSIRWKEGENSDRRYTFAGGIHQAAWRRKQEVVILFLDIKGAFPNVAIPVLVHNMRTMGFHPKYTEWITNRTTNRETVLAFDDYMSQPFVVKHGLDQGCNLSPFKYNCYSAGQMKALSGKDNELGNTFADDGVCAASAGSLERAGTALGEMFR